MPEQTDTYISSFPDAESITDADKVTGLQGGANKNFTFSSILSWIALKLSNAFVSASRTINGKSLSSDVTLTATDVGARPNTWTPSAADVGAIPTTAKGAPLGVAELDSNGQVPSSQLDLSGKQDEITASGILKGDGAGGVSAATPGTDYQAPLTAGTDYATPAQLADKASKADLTNIQATGTTNNTGAAIPAGAYFYLNGILHRAKTQIDQNATFTVNTNCEQVPGGGLNNVGFIDISSYIRVNLSRLNNAKIKARYYPGSKKVELQAEGTVATTLSAGHNTLFLAASPYAPPSGEQQFAGCGVKNSQTPVAVWASSTAINVQHGGASVGDKIAISLSWLLG